MALLWKFLHTLAAIVLVPVLLFEEWGWAPLAAQVARLGRLPLWARLERRLAALPPWAALLVFFVPVVLLFPVKLLALLLFSDGHYASGLALLASAKLVGTAMVARLYQLVQPSLMRIAWFARWHPRWTAWKNRVLGAVRRSAPWQAVRRLRSATRRRWRTFWRTH
jgi:hypothetical protein